MQAEIELLCTSKPQHLGCSTSMTTPPLTCDPGRADRVNLPRVLSPHEEATFRCAKARPGSNSSTGSQAPVRSKTSGPHASPQHTANRSRFHRSLWRCAPCRTHPICFRQLKRNCKLPNCTLFGSFGLFNRDGAVPEHSLNYKIPALYRSFRVAFGRVHH